MYLPMPAASTHTLHQVWGALPGQPALPTLTQGPPKSPQGSSPLPGQGTGDPRGSGKESPLSSHCRWLPLSFGQGTPGQAQKERRRKLQPAAAPHQPPNCRARCAHPVRSHSSQVCLLNQLAAFFKFLLIFSTHKLYFLHFPFMTAIAHKAIFLSNTYIHM